MEQSSFFCVQSELFENQCTHIHFLGGFPPRLVYTFPLLFVWDKGEFVRSRFKKIRIFRVFLVKILSYPKIKDLVFRKIPQQIVRGISKTNFLPVWGRQFHACIVSNVFQHSNLLFYLLIPVFCLIFLVICVLFYKNWVITSNQPPGCFLFFLHFGSILILQVELKTKTPQNVFLFKDAFYCT